MSGDKGMIVAWARRAIGMSGGMGPSGAWASGGA